MNDSMLRAVIVLVGAAIYWGGVYINAQRIKLKTGHVEGMRPQGLHERVIWCGWLSVVSSWMGQPIAILGKVDLSIIELCEYTVHSASLVLGTGFLSLGFLGTWFCYLAMGDSWKMWDHDVKKPQLVTQGAYRYVRHPIYVFQILMTVGNLLLLPTVLSVLIVLILIMLVSIKAHDEEAYLMRNSGQEFQVYFRKTGGFIPKG